LNGHRQVSCFFQLSQMSAAEDRLPRSFRDTPRWTRGAWKSDRCRAPHAGARPVFGVVLADVVVTSVAGLVQDSRHNVSKASEKEKLNLLTVSQRIPNIRP
jgi:hypothetical protein